MEMKVKHRLAGTSTDVGHEPPPIVEFLLDGHLGSHREDRSQHVTVVRSQVSRRRDVANRNHQDMGGSLRVDITKRHRMIAAGDDIGWGISCCYGAEQAILAQEVCPLGVGDTEFGKAVGESVFALIQQQ